MQKFISKIMAWSILLVLSGCNIPGLRQPDSGASLPDDFNGATSPDNSALMSIDEFFEDPVLSQLIAEGLASNLELKIRNQEVEIASNEVLSRRGAYLPFIFGGARGGFDRTSRFTPLGAAEDQLVHPFGLFPDPLPNTAITANLFWRIDIWRELRNARDAAIERYCEAVERRNYFVTELVADIAQNYYELAALDKRLVFLNQNIEIQKKSLEVANAQKEAARGTELAVQRFLAEVRKNESQRLIVTQSIIEVENRINFLVGRYPQFVERAKWDLIKLDTRILSTGVPSDLLQNRRDVIAAEHEIAASGLDVLVAKARFYPRLDITARVGTEAFDPKYLVDPGAFIANAAGELIVPLINRKALQAEYMNANARQLQAIYDYQQTLLNAFTEVVNSMAKADNYGKSVSIKMDQVKALELSVSVAYELFGQPIGEEFAKVEYVDVLLATRDLLEARTALIENKQQQLAAIVDVYQALGGGYLMPNGGMGYDGLWCPPSELEPGNPELSPTPVDESIPPPPAEAAAPAGTAKSNP